MCPSLSPVVFGKSSVSCPFQTTLCSPLQISGKGVHSGEESCLSLLPAKEDTGIVFQRLSHSGQKYPRLPARHTEVTALALCTTLGPLETHGVATIEHLMAALSGFGIDNLHIQLSGREVPVLDGSSAPFLRAFEKVGLQRQSKPRKFLKILKKVEVSRGASRASLAPYPAGLLLDVTILFQTPAIGEQRFVGVLSPQMFSEELAAARTFGFLEDHKKLQELGLARGSSLENSVVIAEERVLNPEGLRWSDECVRHKTLDAVGDLALAGLPILGAYTSYKGGHALNHAILEAVFADPTAAIIVSALEEEEASLLRDNELRPQERAFLSA